MSGRAERTTPHEHPDSVMVTLSAFRRRVVAGDGSAQRDVELPTGLATRLPAQRHAGENIGETATHTIFVDLKESAPSVDDAALGPADQ